MSLSFSYAAQTNASRMLTGSLRIAVPAVAGISMISVQILKTALQCPNALSFLFIRVIIAFELQAEMENPGSMHWVPKSSPCSLREPQSALTCTSCRMSFRHSRLRKNLTTSTASFVRIFLFNKQTSADLANQRAGTLMAELYSVIICFSWISLEFRMELGCQHVSANAFENMRCLVPDGKGDVEHIECYLAARPFGAKRWFYEIDAT